LAPKSKVKSDDLSIDLVTLFRRPEGTKNIFEYANRSSKRRILKNI
jgi:hypothetical protein